MNKKIENIFSFLSENRCFNHSLQQKFYQSVILPNQNTSEKVLSLLYAVANTQSQPRIDKLSSFYQFIHKKSENTNSFENFLRLIRPNSDISYDSLFQGLKAQNGWGNKTSALFTKAIYHLHNGKYPEKLKIWNDVPCKIEDNDNLYLPVDAVIIQVFRKLDDKINWNFDKINRVLKQNYEAHEIEIWDDLWFWGFITQKGSTNREFVWNEEKYWNLKETDKDQKTISEIKIKSEQFLNIFI